MPNTTVPAAAEGLLILNAVDLLADARRIVELIIMAAESLEREQANPITTVGWMAVDKMKEIAAMLHPTSKDDMGAGIE